MFSTVVAVAVVATVVAIVSPGADAAIAQATWTVSPSEGPPGTVITVEGANCLSDDAYGRQVSVQFNFSTISASFLETVAPNQLGAWSVTGTVPEGVGKDAQIVALCQQVDDGDVVGTRFSYGAADFTVAEATIEPGALSVNPSNGPPGAAFAVEGTNCIDGGNGQALVNSPGAVNTNSIYVANGTANGVWILALAVEADTPPGTVITVSADCYDRDNTLAFRPMQDVSVYSYEPVTFTVTAPDSPDNSNNPDTPDDPTTPDDPQTPGAATSPSGSVDVATEAPADPVVAEPTLTG